MSDVELCGDIFETGGTVRQRFACTIAKGHAGPHEMWVRHRIVMAWQKPFAVPDTPSVQHDFEADEEARNFRWRK